MANDRPTDYRTIHKPVRKKDAMQLLLGKPAYMDDLAPRDALIVKILRSPHANAMLAEIDTSAALKVPGVAAVYTWRDVPQERFTIAGQTYPEPSPYDRLILDRHVRFAGDAVAIIAAETEKAALKAMKLIKVQYDVLPAVLDLATAKDNETLVHPEEDWHPTCPCLLYTSCLPDGPKVGSVTLSPRGDWRMPSDACCALWMDELDKIRL